jgi:hypothetical protein
VGRGRERTGCPGGEEMEVGRKTTGLWWMLPELGSGDRAGDGERSGGGGGAAWWRAGMGGDHSWG